MSIIKSDDTAVTALVRGFSSSLPPSLDVVDPLLEELEALRGDLHDQRVKIQLLEDDIGQFDGRLAQAHADGMTAGRTAGRQEAEAQRDGRLEKIDRGICAALELFGSEMAELERLAALLAREALGRIVGDPESHAQILQQIIRSQLAKLESKSVLRIEVSREDFPDAAAISQVADAAGHPGVEVRTLDNRASGDCLIKLRLGELDVGINQQWGRLSALLMDLSEPQGVE